MSDRKNNDVFTPNEGPKPPHAHVPKGVGVRDVMKDDFGLEIPNEAVPLPSNGLVYPVDSMLHGKELVEIKAMTAKEEDILTSRALIKKGTVITHLIDSCLVDKRIKSKDMLIGDRNALMVALRITGYGAEYATEVECPECGTKSKYEFDLGSLPIKRMEITPETAGENVFSFVLPYTKKKVFFKFLTGLDEEDINRTAEKQRKMGQLTDSLVTLKLKRSILQIENVSDPGKIATFVSRMPARDSRALRKFIDDNEPGIMMESWFECPACGEGSEVTMPLGATFFWPDSE